MSTTASSELTEVSETDAFFGADVDTTDRTKQVAKCASVSLTSVNSEEAVVDSERILLGAQGRRRN